MNYMKKKVGGYVGVVTVSHKGDIGIYFNSQGMAWAVGRDNTLSWGIVKGDEYSEIMM